MFSMWYRNGGWRDPEIIPYGPIEVEPAVASLHYGQTVFEGLKAFRGTDGTIRVFRANMNAERLEQSCERLCIPPIDRELFVEAIRELIRLDHMWIPHKRGESLYVRPLVFGTEPHLEVRPSREFRFLIMTSPVREYFDTQGVSTVSLKVEEHYTRSAPGGMGFAKTAGNYAATLQPGEESRRQGFDQVLWLDGQQHRYVEEVGQMNIFFQLGDRLITPALRGTILPGVTRDSVLTLARANGITVDERLITVDEILTAIDAGSLREAFGAGTASVIAPVGRISYRGLSRDINEGRPGPLSMRLYRQIGEIQHGDVPDIYGWTTPIDVV